MDENDASYNISNKKKKKKGSQMRHTKKKIFLKVENKEYKEKCSSCNWAWDIFKYVIGILMSGKNNTSVI